MQQHEGPLLAGISRPRRTARPHARRTGTAASASGPPREGSTSTPALSLSATFRHGADRRRNAALGSPSNDPPAIAARRRNSLRARCATVHGRGRRAVARAVRDRGPGPPPPASSDCDLIVVDERHPGVSPPVEHALLRVLADRRVGSGAPSPRCGRATAVSYGGPGGAEAPDGAASTATTSAALRPPLDSMPQDDGAAPALVELAAPPPRPDSSRPLSGGVSPSRALWEVCPAAVWGRTSSR